MKKEIKILIVEDSTTARTILRRTLRELGYKEILEAESARQALTIVGEERYPFDLVICDWHMPEMSGLDLLRELRKTRSPSQLPVLMLTSETAKAKIVEAVKSGVTDYVVKPFTTATIEEKLRNVFGEKTPLPLTPKE